MCGNKYSTKGSTTTTLLRHLEQKHETEGKELRNLMKPAPKRKAEEEATGTSKAQFKQPDIFNTKELVKSFGNVCDVLLSTNVTFVTLTLTLFNLGSRIMDRLVDFF